MNKKRDRELRHIETVLEDARRKGTPLQREATRRSLLTHVWLIEVLERYQLTLDSGDVFLSYVDSKRIPFYWEPGEVASLRDDEMECGGPLFLTVARHPSHQAQPSCRWRPDKYSTPKICSVCKQFAHLPCSNKNMHCYRHTKCDWHTQARLGIFVPPYQLNDSGATMNEKRAHELRRFDVIEALLSSTQEGTLGQYEECRGVDSAPYRKVIRHVLRTRVWLHVILERYQLALDSRRIKLEYVDSNCTPHYWEPGEVTSLCDRLESGGSLRLTVGRHPTHQTDYCVAWSKSTSPPNGGQWILTWPHDRSHKPVEICSICWRYPHDRCVKDNLYTSSSSSTPASIIFSAMDTRVSRMATALSQ